MNEQEIRGAVDNVPGKIHGAAGALTGDTVQEVKGKAREVAGSVQGKAGQALTSALDIGASNPMGTTLFAGAVGFVFDALFTKRD
ncbi:CsbD family protein [Rhodanobacter sp. MP7CTX1]|uniref:CsbD family protein n=1 Tax=Rhodanobacter sp. MP7CTX1 TaxID=2723084 RepID=UPI00161738A3|nr:CsbD family protein [Rhodanobacter sp. MP7CTX1]MBB6187627.1 uncharacterized protein YjbJ (UPF0337 family) [Rhodanobacter sp. MP7CTX1]